MYYTVIKHEGNVDNTSAAGECILHFLSAIIVCFCSLIS